MEFIAWKELERKLFEPDKARRVFRVRGRRVLPEKIERWKKRKEFTVDKLEAFDFRPGKL